MKTVRVIGIGQACVDYLGRIGSYPPEDGKIELMDLSMQCGGPAATALVTLSRLGVKSSFIGSISDDYFGKKILEGLHSEDIDTTNLKITPGFSSQFAFIAITQRTAKRSIFWRRGTVPFLESEDISIGGFSEAKVLHLDSLMIEAGIEAAVQARRMGLKVVMDAGTMRKGAERLLPLVDILIASESFAAPIVRGGISPEKSIIALKRLCKGTIIVTLGEKGCVGSLNGEMIRQKAFKVKAIDTTGAGDVFHGAYIYGLLQEWGVRECMRFASAVSALKCRKIGAWAGIPGIREVKNFLEKC
ncbi:MAG: sugar kinase [Deltaproteobacteria bacterium]|nr:sugar kinase [Deltaproteobacteria bacterium]